MSPIEIQKIIFEGSGKAEIFNFRPENIEKEKRGNLFVVGRIAKKLPRHDQQYYLLNSLAAIIKKEYYSPSFLQPSGAFDGALKKANSLLLEAPQEIAGAMELVVLILVGEQVNFSSIGNPEILLLREERIFRLHKNPRSIKNLSTPINENSRGKHSRIALFHHVTKGRIKAGDRIIIAASDLTRWLENTHFKVRLAKRTWEGIKEYLRQKRIEIHDESTLPIIQISLNGSSFSYPRKDNVENGKHGEEPFRLSANIPSHSQLRLPILQERERMFPHLPAYRSLANLHHKKNLSLNDNTIIFLRSFARIALSRRYIFLIGTFIIIAIGVSMLIKNENEVPKQEYSLADSRIEETGLFSSFTRPEKSSTGNHFLYTRFSQNDIFVIWQNQLYNIDENSHKTEALLSFQGEIKAIESLRDALLILIKKTPEELELIFFNPSERSIKKEPLSWPLSTYAIKDMKEFNENIYLLETSEKQIVKYDIRDLSRPILWLSEKTKSQLQNPVGFALERSIYLLQSAPPAIIELRAGDIKRRIVFDGKADGILTSLELKNLYLFDSEEGRILIIKKETGKTLKIIKDSRFTNIVDIEADETRNLLQVVTSKGRITLTQVLP